MTESEKILTLDSLLIGYGSGKDANILLPPLTSSAVKGELIALIGQNGIGKSTLLRTITGLQPPLSGNVFINVDIVVPAAIRIRLIPYCNGISAGVYGYLRIRREIDVVSGNHNRALPCAC